MIRVVLDNLNANRMASLYEDFPAPEAKRIARRLEFHHTPKHGSWLDMAEIEFSVLARACLNGRNPSKEALQKAPTSTRRSATRRQPPSTGASPSRTPEPNSAVSILTRQL